MPRRPRYCPGGTCFHVLNRAVARLPLFEKEQDYEAFERVLTEAQALFPLPILAFCLMPNHWHFVVRPSTDEELSSFFRWLTHTHVMRWHAHYHTEGTGHLYQGRFKAFPIEEDDHLYAVLRYVERNPVRARLCERAEDWKFGSLWRRVNGNEESRSILSDWPLPRPRNWRAHVNKPQSESEVSAIRTSVRRGTPYGGDSWVTQSAARLQLKHTLRCRGRPRKTHGDKKGAASPFHFLFTSDSEVPSAEALRTHLPLCFGISEIREIVEKADVISGGIFSTDLAERKGRPIPFPSHPMLGESRSD